MAPDFLVRYFLQLHIRHAFGKARVEPQHLFDPRRNFAVVARDHRDPAYPRLAQPGQGFLRVLAQFILDDETAQHAFLVGDKDGGRTLPRGLLQPSRYPGGDVAPVVDQPQRADLDVPVALDGPGAAAFEFVESVRHLRLDVLFSGILADRARDRMVGALLDEQGRFDHAVLDHAEGLDLGHHGPGVGQRPGLVHQQRAHLGKFFHDVLSLEDDPAAGGPEDPRVQAQRRGQHDGHRADRDQHRQTPAQGLQRSGPARREFQLAVKNEHPRADDQRRRNENPREALDDARGVRTIARRLLDKPFDMGQRGGRARAFHAHLDCPGLDHAAGKNLFPDRARPEGRFPRQRRFANLGPPRRDHPVGGDHHPLLDHQDLTGRKLVHSHLDHRFALSHQDIPRIRDGGAGKAGDGTQRRGPFDRLGEDRHEHNRGGFEPLTDQQRAHGHNRDQQLDGRAPAREQGGQRAGKNRIPEHNHQAVQRQVGRRRERVCAAPAVEHKGKGDQDHRDGEAHGRPVRRRIICIERLLP